MVAWIRAWLRLALVGASLWALAGCGGGASGSSEASCTVDAECGHVSVEPCYEAFCDAGSGQCAVRASVGGAACGQGSVCYAGACLATCETTSACGEGNLCAVKRLGSGVTGGVCLANSEVACSSDGACLEVLVGPCEAASCDVEAGHCGLGRAADGGACGQGGACYHGVCYPSCGAGAAPCVAGQACLQPRDELSICVPEHAIPCGGHAECGSLVTALCHLPVCVSGVCAASVAPNGSDCAAGRTCWSGACVGFGACDDHHGCASGAACVAGVGGEACVATEALVCAGPSDCDALVERDCFEAICDPATHRCGLLPVADGLACRSDGVCLGGACVPACVDSASCAPGTFCRALAGGPGGGCAEVPCASAGDCAGLLVTTLPCESVTCNTLTNRCQLSPLPENASCDDGDLCNGVQRCRDGACVLTSKAVSCVTPPGQGCTLIACDPASGACVAASADDGTACDDGSPCTVATTCHDGACLGEVTCTTCTYDQDCLASDDGDLCNGLPLCLGGVCVWSPTTLVACPDPVDACQVAACEPATGACLAVPDEDGVPCEVSTDLCAARFACSLGACVEADPAVVCPPPDDACVLAACDPSSGLCTNVPLDVAPVLVEDFDGATPSLWLLTDAPGASAGVSSDDANSAPAALHLHADGAGAAASPAVFLSSVLPLPTEVALGVRVAAKAVLDVGAGDAIRVALGSDAAGWQPLLEVDAAHPLSADWTTLELALPMLSESVRLRVTLVALGPAGVDLRLDDVRVVRPCP